MISEGRHSRQENDRSRYLGVPRAETVNPKAAEAVQDGRSILNGNIFNSEGMLGGAEL